MNQSTIIIIAIILVLLVSAGVAVSMNKGYNVKASLFSAHRMVDNKDIKKYVSAHNLKLNHPNNLLYPEILTMLPPSALVHITPETMADTNILVDIIMSKISLSSVEQLKNLSPAVIAAMNPFQLFLLDEMLIGPNNDYAPLDALVPQTLSVEQALAFHQKMSPSHSLPPNIPVKPTPLLPGMPFIPGVTLKN